MIYINNMFEGFKRFEGIFKEKFNWIIGLTAIFLIVSCTTNWIPKTKRFFATKGIGHDLGSSLKIITEMFNLSVCALSLRAQNNKKTKAAVFIYAVLSVLQTLNHSASTQKILNLLASISSAAWTFLELKELSENAKKIQKGKSLALGIIALLALLMNASVFLNKLPGKWKNGFTDFSGILGGLYWAAFLYFERSALAAE